MASRRLRYAIADGGDAWFGFEIDDTNAVPAVEIADDDVTTIPPLTVTAPNGTRWNVDACDVSKVYVECVADVRVRMQLWRFGVAWKDHTLVGPGADVLTAPVGMLGSHLTHIRVRVEHR